MKCYPRYFPGMAALLISACAMTQSPVQVSQTPGELPDQAQSPPVSAAPVAGQGAASVVRAQQTKTVAPVEPRSRKWAVSDLGGIAKAMTRNAAADRKYAGDTLGGHAKFVRVPKGNPNVAVADVTVAGLGEVSLWCRSVLPGNKPSGKTVAFEGVLYGRVYTSEDFSHDVYMKDCRFHD